MASSSARCVAESLHVHLRWTVVLAVLFALTYGGTNYAAGQMDHRFRFYFAWELGIPFVPWMIYVYLSLPVLLTAPAFLLRPDSIRRFACDFAVVTIIAAGFHLLLPADLGWSRREPSAFAFALLYTFDAPHNLVPSLHVGYATLAYLHLRPAVSRAGRLALLCWLAALISSVLLTRQHHIIDVASGLALGASVAAIRTRDRVAALLK